MMELSCDTLAEIVRGQLRFGTMPPLGGPHEPVLRIVLDSRTVEPGEVFWDLAGDPSCAGGSAEEAFVRGAAGVVSPRALLEPWAGTFVVQVPDARRALFDLGAWARRRCRQKFLTVAGTATGLMSEIVRRSLQPRRRAQASSGLPATVSSAAELALRLAQDLAPIGWHVVGVAAQENRAWCEISHLCHPHAAAIYSARDANMSHDGLPRQADDFLSLVAALPDSGLAVLAEPEAPWRELVAKTTHATVLGVGRGAAMDFRVQWQPIRNEELRFTLQGQPVCVAAHENIDPAAVVMACATARILGATLPAIVAACEDCYERAENHGRLHKGNMEVPPQVSGLRESDTSLPPGLKRYAC